MQANYTATVPKTQTVNDEDWQLTRVRQIFAPLGVTAWREGDVLFMGKTCVKCGRLITRDETLDGTTARLGRIVAFYRDWFNGRDMHLGCERGISLIKPKPSQHSGGGNGGTGGGKGKRKQSRKPGQRSTRFSYAVQVAAAYGFELVKVGNSSYKLRPDGGGEWRRFPNLDTVLAWIAAQQEARHAAHV